MEETLRLFGKDGGTLRLFGEDVLRYLSRLQSKFLRDRKSLVIEGAALLILRQ